MALVLILVSNGTVDAGHVRRVSSFKGLHRLLVDADDDFALRWIEGRGSQTAFALGRKSGSAQVQPLRDVMPGGFLLEAEDAADLAGAEAVPGLGRQDIRQRGVRPHIPEPHDLVVRSFAGQAHQLTANRQRHPRRSTTACRVLQRLQRRCAVKSSLPLPHSARRPSHRAGDLFGPAPFMTMQHDPGALDDQMDVAPSPNELFELPKQIAMKVKTTGAGSAWHTLSIDLALRLFPKPGSNFGSVVLVCFLDDGLEYAPTTHTRIPIHTAVRLK